MSFVDYKGWADPQFLKAGYAAKGVYLALTELLADLGTEELEECQIHCLGHKRTIKKEIQKLVDVGLAEWTDLGLKLCKSKRSKDKRTLKNFEENETYAEVKKEKDRLRKQAGRAKNTDNVIDSSALSEGCPKVVHDVSIGLSAECPQMSATTKNQEPRTNKEKINKKESGIPDRKKGTRLTADWTPTETDKAFAKTQGLDPEATADMFRDYWLSAAGERGVKLDWQATWRNWCRSDYNKPKNGSGRDGRTAEEIRLGLEYKGHGRGRSLKQTGAVDWENPDEWPGWMTPAKMAEQ